MKLITSFSIFLLLGTPTVNSQEMAKVAVQYKLTYVIDTTQPEMPDIAFFTLYQGKTTSKYVDYVDESSGAVYATIISGQPLYKNFVSNKLIREIPLNQSLYAITDELPAVQWTLGKEQIKLLGYDCQSATGFFRGRNYIAWFASKLPYRNGPWKLGGLPGLILKMYDEKKEIIWEAMKVNTDPDPREALIQSNKNAINVTFDEYKKVSDALIRNPSAMAGASASMAMPPGVRSVTAVPHGGGGAIVKKRRSFNNPIEILPNN